MPLLAVITWDLTISIGNIIGGLGLLAAGFIGRRIYKALSDHVLSVSMTREMVDEHTDILRPLAGKKAAHLEYVGERRFLTRRDEDRL